MTDGRNRTSPLKLFNYHTGTLVSNTAATKRRRLRPGEVGQPRRHVLKAEMLHLDVGRSEALDAFLQELQRQVRLVGREPLTNALDEDGVVGRNAQT